MKTKIKIIIGRGKNKKVLEFNGQMEENVYDLIKSDINNKLNYSLLDPYYTINENGKIKKYCLGKEIDKQENID